MDAEAREKFRHQLRTDPPEVSVENCLATVESLILDSRNIFLRGIANVFSRLDRRFRTHDAFAIGSKIIFDCAFSEYGSWSGRHCDEYLRDVERSEEHTSELQSLMRISYAVFCLKNNISLPSRPTPHHQ